MAREYMYTPPRNSDSIWGDVTQAQSMHHCPMDQSSGSKRTCGVALWLMIWTGRRVSLNLGLQSMIIGKRAMAGDYHELSIGNLW